MLTLPIYLDYSATTPVDARVAEKMFAFLTQRFGNPASLPGRERECPKALRSRG